MRNFLKKSASKEQTKQLVQDPFAQHLRLFMQQKGITTRQLKEVLDLAIVSLSICETIHQDTGQYRISLQEVAKEVGKGVTKEEIQEAFHLLVVLEIIGDDGDYDYMNYDQGIITLKNDLETMKDTLEVE